MGKDILIITGSARKQGNSDLLADAFTKGAQAAGHEVTKFESAVDRIDGCIACDTCWSRDKPCTFDDGFDKLSPLLEKADVLILCSPLYWFTFSTYLKAAVDKFYSYMVPQCPRKLKPKEIMLLMCAEDTEQAAFNGSAATYKSIVDYLKWTDRGMLLVTGVSAKGEITKTDALARAEKLGSEI